jgi:hypothetical protein
MDTTPIGVPPKVETSGNMRILAFTGGRRDIENMLGRELDGRTDGLAGCHLLLDFTNVEALGGEELGTLIGLHKKLAACGGRLTLFNLSAQVYEVLVVTRLHTLLGFAGKNRFPPVRRLERPCSPARPEKRLR